MNKTFEIQFQNPNSKSSSSDQLILLTILKMLYVYGYIIVCFVSLLNNVLILSVLTKKHSNEIKISRSLLTDYCILAVLDIVVMETYYFTKWLGKKHFFIRHVPSRAVEA